VEIENKRWKFKINDGNTNKHWKITKKNEEHDKTGCEA